VRLELVQLTGWTGRTGSGSSSALSTSITGGASSASITHNMKSLAALPVKESEPALRDVDKNNAVNNLSKNVVSPYDGIKAKHFLLDADYINLNHGSFGTVPRIVFDEQVRMLRLQESRPDDWFRLTYYQLIDQSEWIACI
jgi:hypothetical protein